MGEMVTRGWLRGALLLAVAAAALGACVPEVGGSGAGANKRDDGVLEHMLETWGYDVVALREQGGIVHVEVQFRDALKVPANTRPSLQIEDAVFTKSYAPKGGRMDGRVFVLSKDEFDALTDGAPVFVDMGVLLGVGARATDTVDIPRLEKGRLEREEYGP